MTEAMALSMSDVEAVVRLLGEIAGTSDPIVDKRRRLVTGLADIVGADVWLWTQGRGHAPETPVAYSLLDGGFTRDGQKARLLEALTDPDWDRLCQQRMTRLDGRPIPGPPHLTRTRGELVADEAWRASSFYGTRYAATDLDEYVLSVYPLGGDEWSAVGLWRRRGRPAFGDRDKAVAHLVTAHVDWLHRAGSNVPAADRVRSLSPRKQQVLLLLLAGEGVKQIARNLELSEHTVNDHLKALHAHFNVSSRGELLSRFIAGGRTTPQVRGG